MGSQSKFHGLTGISSRRIKSNVSKRNRKTRLNSKKVEANTKMREVLKSTPEIG